MPPVEIDAGHSRHGGKRNKGRCVGRELAAAQPVLFLRQHYDRAPFRRFVGQGSQLSRIGKLLLGNARSRNKFRRAAVAQRDRAGFVEQERVNVARCFHGAAGHRKNVALNHAVHARDTDGGKQSADRRGDQADEQRDQHENRLRRAGIDRHRLQRNHGQQENDRQPGQQNIERDLVGRLLPLGAFDQLDHAVKERLAGVRRDAHDNFDRKARACRPLPPSDRRRIRGSPARIRR